MKLFRNPDIKQGTLLFLCLALAAGGVGQFFFKKTEITGFILLLSFLFWGIFLFISRRRYKKMEHLASQIDAVLHGNEKISFQSYTEGDFSILQSEIYKMTVRLREQQHRLQQDKIHLADSIADISHQIRTPLTSINLLLSLLAEKPLPPDGYPLIHELTVLSNRIEHLVTALLKISKLDAGTIIFERKTLPLKLLLEKSIQPLLIPAELQEITFSVQERGSFEGDLLWSSEALTNILKNCLEHTPQGGKITVTASENAIYSEIVVQDTGTGIPEKDLPHIFERFYKGENCSQNSFGIGLALARMIVTAQQGTIRAKNCPNGGAMFLLRFYKQLAPKE